MGYSQTEILTGVALVALLLFGLLSVVLSPGGDDGGVPPYRAANAMYVYNALERQRVAVLTYTDMTGMLPGDDTRPAMVDGVLVAGNDDGRIDSGRGEAAKAFVDLQETGVNPDREIRIRGLVLELLWVRLMSGGKVLVEDNFFKLPGVDRQEALAFDRKFDDGHQDAGNAVYLGNDDTVDFYYRLTLIR
ncbi:hypothetical protein [Desulfocurvus sp. DL9XJH121]